MFWKEVSHAYQGSIYLIKCTVILWNIILYNYVFYFNIFLNVIYSCDGKAEFSQLSLHQSLMSHDPSEIVLICWFVGTINVFITVVLRKIFVETIFFSGIFDEYKVKKEPNLFVAKLNSKCFTLSFDLSLLLSLLNKSIIFLKTTTTNNT